MLEDPINEPSALDCRRPSHRLLHCPPIPEGGRAQDRGEMTIKRRDFLKKAGAGTGLAALGACGSSEGTAEAVDGEVSGPRVEWRLATSYPPSVDILYGATDRLAEQVSAATGGNFTIRVYAPGEIVPALQVMDSVMQGTTQCGFSPGYYYTGKHPALAFDTTVPFGFDPRQQVSWLTRGGGLDLINSIYADFGIISFPMGNTAGQMGGWFREPVGGLSDLTGLRMRIPGIGGEIMSRLGVTVQVLGAPEIYPALERGAIDATEWVGPHDDEKLGFHQVAKHYYYPGWWEPGSTASLMISREAWDELPTAYQEILKTACGDILSWTLAGYDEANPAALQRLIQDHGVTLHEFSLEIMEAAWRESNAYLEEQAAADPVFRTVFESFSAFRNQAFPYSAGNEGAYARFTFPKIEAG